MRKTVGLLLLLCASSSAPIAAEDDFAALTRGVDSIGVAGVPGPLCVFGEDAFPVVTGDEDGRPAPLVAAARFGRGRVVLFGHNGYLDPASVGTGALFANAVRWAADRTGKDAATVRVVVHGQPRALDFLRKEGFAASAGDLGDLGKADVLVLDAAGIPSDEAGREIGRFLRAGGGLVAGSLGWGWKQLNPGKDLATDHPGNRLLAEAGIVWADGTLSPTRPNAFVVGPPRSELTHAVAALAFLRSASPGDAKTKAADLALAGATVVRAVRSLPPGAPFRVALDREIARRDPRGLVPTEAAPLGLDRALDRVLLTAQVEDLMRRPAREVTAHPAAKDFPGPVPREAKRVTARVTVDTSSPDWTSTGLYAAPGETITVSVPAGAAEKGLAVRIGAHSDANWHHEAWTRVPAITRVFPLEAPRTEAANAFGGLVYVVVPRGSSLGRIEVTIAGAVPAPLFIAGETDPADWRKEVRDRPGPWAEIGSRKMIVTVPSEVVRGIDDPTEVTRVWDRILDLDAELCARPPERDRPERIVCDRQISAGYMHSGYPIMTFLDQIRNVVDPEHLRRGNWGLFHEVGHNHQEGDWTFDGAVEVTVNLFTLYVYDRLCGAPPEKQERADAAARRKELDGYIDRPDFGKWKSSPFLALTMYVELQQAFGWEAFRDVFAAYRGLDAKERPRTDDEKRDQWLVRFSRRAGRNLGPFFERWGVPVSPAARAAVENLPDWRPEELGGPVLPEAPDPGPK